MSTRSGRLRPSAVELSPPRTRKGVSPPRSPARAKKSSPPARSPSRKSPSRKSPSRKPASKFPARKSPSRTTTKQATESSPKSPAKQASTKTDTLKVKLEDATAKIEAYRATRTRRTEYSIKDLTSPTQNDFASGEKVNGVEALLFSAKDYSFRNRRGEDVPPRRSSRLREFIDHTTDLKRSSSKSVSKSISQSIDTYSDDDNSEEDFKEKSKSGGRKLATPLRESSLKLAQISSRWEFGGRIGSALLIILLPLTVSAILFSCRKSCSLQNLTDITAIKNVSLWFGVRGLYLLVTQYIIQAAFACLPYLGKKADRLDDSGRKQSFNAFAACVFTAALLFTLDFFMIVKSNSILNNYTQLAVISYIIAVLLAVVLYIKSRKLDGNELNPYGNTGYVLYDFWMGCEIHPFLQKLDVKLWISRICNINTLILSILLFNHGFHLPAKSPENLSLDSYKEIFNNIQYKPTILLFSLMQTVYILNFIMNEYKITTTFYWQSEGVGYLQLVASALYPFYFTSIAKFVAESHLSLSTNALIAASVLYVAGFFLMLLSNNIKHEFRKNPLHPSVTHLDSMPTFHGKKLLISSLWGLLRHPNYAGDILVHIALALPGILGREPIAAAPALLTILVLLHRAWRDNDRCRRRYGAAWQRYCKKVPSVIVPKVL